MSSGGDTPGSGTGLLRPHGRHAAQLDSLSTAWDFRRRISLNPSSPAEQVGGSSGCFFCARHVMVTAVPILDPICFCDPGHVHYCNVCVYTHTLWYGTVPAGVLSNPSGSGLSGLSGLSVSGVALALTSVCLLVLSSSRPRSLHIKLFASPELAPSLLI
ncbi:hypothetical protein LY76DRAFT_197163 [Colletotrichum caudatum]|nr:hypothetical protein LY76DRAFT_197163 [Colletotrichum caudatum]